MLGSMPVDQWAKKIMESGVSKINKRLLYILAILLLLVALLPFAAFGQETVSINAISNKVQGDNVIIDGVSTFNEVTIKVLRPDNTVMYIDVAAVNNGSFHKTFKLPLDAVLGTYEVIIGQGTEIEKREFLVTSAGTVSGGGSSGGGGVTTTGTTVTASGGTVTENGVTVEIPFDAIKGQIKVNIEKVAVVSSLPMLENTQLVGDVFELKKDNTATFEKTVTITLPYDKSKIDINKYDLAIYWFDENEKKWVKLSNVKINKETAKVSGEVEHFTKFAVLATEKVIIQPTDNEAAINLKDIVGHWAETNIKRLTAIGAINGYPDGSFKPNDSISRAEFATVLVKALKLNPQSGKVFNDTAMHWAKDNIATAAAYGIVNGYSDIEFGPNDIITREQMAVMIVKAVKLVKAEAETNFTDGEQISTWAKDAVSAAGENNIISGYPDNTFKPKSSATRAEAVTVIVRALKL